MNTHTEVRKNIKSKHPDFHTNKLRITTQRHTSSLHLCCCRTEPLSGSSGPKWREYLGDWHQSMDPSFKWLIKLIGIFFLVMSTWKSSQQYHLLMIAGWTLQLLFIYFVQMLYFLGFCLLWLKGILKYILLLTSQLFIQPYFFFLPTLHCKCTSHDHPRSTGNGACGKLYL